MPTAEANVCVSGRLVTYNEVAPQFGEHIEPGSFGDLAAVDVVLNLQHVRSQHLARTGGGLTLADSKAVARRDRRLALNPPG